MPDFEASAAAPALIVLARLLQGAATGGEFASATAFLIESAPPGRRGFFGSLQMVGQALAALGGATAGMLVTQGLTPEQVDSWGWRVPFIFGLLIGPVGLYIRRHLNETEAFIQASASQVERISLRQLWREHKHSVMACLRQAWARDRGQSLRRRLASNDTWVPQLRAQAMAASTVSQALVEIAMEMPDTCSQCAS